jgi:hypothetical protein
MTATRPFSPRVFLRTLTALAAAPIAGGAVVGLLLTFLERGPITHIGDNIMGGVQIGIIAGLLPAIVIGYPVHLILLRLRWTHPLVYCVLGILIAGLAFAFMMWGITSMDWSRD